MANLSRKVIITCAVTGSIHTPSMSPHLPVTPEEIADAAVGAAEAGAAIIHLHARNPENGIPDQSVEAYTGIPPVIKQRTGAVLNITTGGSTLMTTEERLGPALHHKPEVASLNMGSMNFGLYPMLNRFSEFKHDWEEDYLRTSDDRVFKNTFKDIEMILTRCADNGTRFEIECYDIGHLYTCKHFVDRGLIKGPVFIQSVFGILGGIGQHPEGVLHMKRTADRLFGDNYRWSVLGAGAKQMQIAAQSVMLGGNVRVGLEDSLWLGRGTLAQSNAAQVSFAKKMIEDLGMEVATPDEAREILELKGGMMSTSDSLLVDRAGGVLRLTINRPEKRNAIDDAAILAMTAAFDEASRDPGIRAIVLTGTGDKAFCSGADLGGGVFSFDYSEPVSNYANLLRAARRATVPVIGRINGFCLAGGMGLLAVCDMAVAAPTAKFGLPEVKVGLFPMQVAALLQSMIPARTFAEMCYTGEMLTAQEALDCNLVNYVAEDLDAKTDRLVERVVSKSPSAIRRGKYALNATSGMTFEQSIAFLESQIGLMPQTEDAKEGLQAFAEKRAPKWTGK